MVTCAICLENLADGSVRCLPCMHPFHTACVDDWLTRNHACPVCRHEVREVDNLVQEADDLVRQADLVGQLFESLLNELVQEMRNG